jgi:hypothetical protein
MGEGGSSPKALSFAIVICVTIDGVGLVNRYTDHPQDVTTSNYKTIAISTLYSSLGHTV